MSFKTIGPIEGRQVGCTFEALSLARTVTPADSGTLFTVDADGKAITLSAAADFENGSKIRFVCVVVPTTTWVITSAASDIIGLISTATADDKGDTTDSTPINTVTMATTVCIAGNWVEFLALNDVWYITGHASTDLGIITTAV